ncbi:unnamed protein product [Leptosia nina]|uniref:Uncharacterized protein n=1 Tax=Leptosia nina TaxID=320188 RepID=A0AAV1J3Q9_9NEOP
MDVRYLLVRAAAGCGTRLLRACSRWVSSVRPVVTSVASSRHRCPGCDVGGGWNGLFHTPTILVAAEALEDTGGEKKMEADGRTQPPKIHSSRPSPELAAGDSMTVARGEESPERLGGALRRLHYRATRRAHSAAQRHHSTTPKSARGGVARSLTRIDRAQLGQPVFGVQTICG